MAITPVVSTNDAPAPTEHVMRITARGTVYTVRTETELVVLLRWLSQEAA